MMINRSTAAATAAFLAFMPFGKASVRTKMVTAPAESANAGSGFFLLSIASLFGRKRENSSKVENALQSAEALPNRAPAQSTTDSSWAPNPGAFGVKTGDHVVALYVDQSRSRAFLYDTREIEPPRLTRDPRSIMPRRDL